MKSTRKRLIDYLNTRRVATAMELSHALQVSPADIRHHLAILQARGTVEEVGARKTGGRGRPAALFSLSKQVLGDNLDNLSSALLADALEKTSHEGHSRLLKRIASRLQGDFKTNGSLTNRLYQSINRLNQMNYQARWEAHSNAPHLILGHCPYSDIISNHPELCQMDAELLAGLLGKTVKQTAKLVQFAGGAPFCIFWVGVVKSET